MTKNHTNQLKNNLDMSRLNGIITSWILYFSNVGLTAQTQPEESILNS